MLIIKYLLELSIIHEFEINLNISCEIFKSKILTIILKLKIQKFYQNVIVFFT